MSAQENQVQDGGVFTVVFDNLVRPSSEAFEEMPRIKATVEPFQNDNAPGNMRRVSGWEEVGAIAAESGSRLKRALTG